jgi:uncharacterized protein YdeI (YjbR/CyaY-like superfamily)
VKPENVRFFESPADFRAWLEQNHETADYQWIGFPRKRAGGPPALTHFDAVTEALCFGWIDGQAGKVGDDFLAVRFSKRRKGSIWSHVNVARMNELVAAGRVAPAGMRAFEARTPERTGVYLHESNVVEFSPEQEQRFRANPAAWDFWKNTPPGYRRQMTWWVINAKREETRRRRLDVLIEEHAAGRRIDPVHMPKMSGRP